MKSWLLVLVWLLSSGFGFQLQGEMPLLDSDPVLPSGDEGATGRRYEAVIDYATVRTEHGWPAELYVEGYFPADCDMPLNVEWSKRGTTLQADVFYVAGPGQSCKRQRVYFAETVAGFGVIVADLPPGEYQVVMNGYRVWFDVPDEPPPTREPRKTPTPTPPPPPDDDVVREYAVIESVNAIVFESYPMRVHLHVRGYHGTGCSTSTHIDQYRSGRTVIVDIYRLVNPRMMCPAIVEYFDEVIVLEGGFEYGTYTVHVNDYVMILDLWYRRR